MVETPKKADTTFVVLWVIVSVIGTTFGGVLGVIIGENVGFPVGNAIAEMLRLSEEMTAIGSSTFAGFLNSSCYAIVLSLGQWLVLRRHIQNAIWWIPATAGFIVVGGMANSALITWLGMMVPSGGTWLLVFFCTGLIMNPVWGALIGTTEWLVLRRQIPQAYWWIAVRAVTDLIVAVVEVVGGVASILTGSDLSRYICMAGYSVVTGVALGLMTGLALFWLMNRERPESPNLEMQTNGIG